MHYKCSNYVSKRISCVIYALYVRKLGFLPNFVGSLYYTCVCLTVGITCKLKTFYNLKVKLYSKLKKINITHMKQVKKLKSTTYDPFFFFR